MDWADLNCGVYATKALVHWLLQGVKLPGSVGSWNPFLPGFRAPWDGTVRQEVLEKFGSVLASASTVLQAASVVRAQLPQATQQATNRDGWKSPWVKSWCFLSFNMFQPRDFVTHRCKNTQVTRFYWPKWMDSSMDWWDKWPEPPFFWPYFPCVSMGKFHGFSLYIPVKNLEEVHWIQHLPGFFGYWMSLAGIKIGIFGWLGRRNHWQKWFGFTLWQLT